jgi:hypothetical protein
MTNWTITNTDRNTADGFIFCVHYTASQVDGDFSASTYSTVSFTKEDGINYVPYASLTEAQVVEWVKASLGEEGVAAVDLALANNIAAQKNPPVATGTPWTA